MGSTQYDNITSAYNKLHDSLEAYPCGQLEEGNVHATLENDIRKKRVLELGCGSGHYSHRLLEWGAQSVVGVDISEDMVAEARIRASKDGASERLRFEVADVSAGTDFTSLNEGKPFDLVAVTWVLNYASSRKDMEGMWKTVSLNLAPGGLFVGLTIPPPLGNQVEFERHLLQDGKQYGVVGHIQDVVEDGFKVLTVLGQNSGVEFENYYLRPAIYEQSCKTAGVGKLEWLPLILPDKLRNAFPAGFWNSAVFNPWFRICRVRKE